MRSVEVFSLRRPTLSSACWYLTVLAGWGLILVALVNLLTAQHLTWPAAFAMTAALGVALEALPLVQGRGHDPQGVVMSTAFLCALLFVWGPWPAIAMVAAGSLLSDLRARKAWWKIGFNPAQYALCFGAAALVCSLVSHRSLSHPLSTFRLVDLTWMAAAWIVFFVANLVLVAGVMATRTGFLANFLEDFWHNALMTMAVLALSPLVVVVGLGPWQLMPLLLIPLLLLYSTAQIALEREHDAGHDALTGLPNRATLQFELHEALSDFERDGVGFALMLIDLDDFKRVNDTLGHQVGDALLMEFAHRLQAGVRQGDVVARLGGDEFAVVIRDVGRQNARAFGSRVAASVADAFAIDALRLEVNLSLGIALCPEHGSDATSLLRRADIAMYEAKQRASVMEVYSPDTDDNSPDRLGLLGELREALLNEEIDLHYQPKVDATTGRPLGVEALIRWLHPERGYVSPDDFIPMAERSGVMPLLTSRVLELAISRCARWREEGLDVPIAVNVSPTDIVGDVLVDVIVEMLGRYGVDAGLLQLEITERLSTRQVEKATTTLQRLRGLGVCISLDDFGTGYSSLPRLSSLTVDEIKIDRVFISRMTTQTSAVGIVQALVDLAHALGLPAVAEGVETEAEWAAVRDTGCDAVQGWAVAPPMPAGPMADWLRAAGSPTRPRHAATDTPVAVVGEVADAGGPAAQPGVIALAR